MRHYIFAVTAVFLFVLCDAASAQNPLYGTQLRPRGLDWQQLKTGHFRVIFPKGEEEAALRTGKILEQHYPDASALTGGALNNFPVVLSNYNDMSNGSVHSINFRSEFDLSPIIGKSMNPVSGDWLEEVLPHELLHATHANINKPFSLGGLVRIFAPDMARSINFYPPVGLHEGLAVYYESNYTTTGGGRLNYTYFNNQLHSNLASGKPWSMSQIFQPPSATLPYDRHYIAGSHFMQWMAKTYGEESIRKSLNFHYNFFFLGYGTALRHSTGSWPRKLRQEFLTSAKAQETERLNLFTSNTSEKHRVIDVPYKGVRMQGPVWISENEILYYSSQYNAVRGFYIHDLSSGKSRLLKETTAAADYAFNFDAESGMLYFSKYGSSRLYPGSYLADIYQLDTASGRTKQLTKRARTYAPSKQGSRILALQTSRDRADLVAINEDGRIETIYNFEDSTPVSVAANPVNTQQIALIINKNGTQGLWITTARTITEDLKKEPAVAFKNGSVHDVSWHPEGTKLLFTADQYPAMNIYEYHPETGKVIQLTSTLFNAFEASYSPGGEAIVYVFLSGEEHKLAVLKKEDFYNVKVAGKRLLPGGPAAAGTQKGNEPSEPEDIDITNWTTGSYGKDLRWLKPRAILPVWYKKAETYQFGAAAYGTDALGSQSYSAEITGIQNRLWYNFSYTSKTFLPGFKLRFYSDPSFFFFNSDKDGDGINDYTGTNIIEQMGLMSEERGGSLSVPFTVRSRDLSRSTMWYAEPKITLEQLRYFDLAPKPLSGFSSQYKAGYFTQLNWRLLSLPRGVQPASGLVLFSSFEKALNNPVLDLTFPSGNTYELTLAGRRGHYFGVFGYLSPLRRFNQSLMLDVRFLQQSKNLLYSTDTITPFGFKDAVFPESDNLGRFSAKYTIPLFHTDNGFFLVPFHLKTIYLSAFTHTISDLNSGSLTARSRTIAGGGLHFLFRVANINFSFGAGLAYEPARRQTQFIMGSF